MQDWSFVIMAVGFIINLIITAGNYYTFKAIIETSMSQIKKELTEQKADIEELKKADIEHTKDANENQKELLKMISEININVAVTNKSLDVLNVIADIFGTATRNNK